VKAGISRALNESCSDQLSRSVQTDVERNWNPQPLEILKLCIWWETEKGRTLSNAWNNVTSVTWRIVIWTS